VLDQLVETGRHRTESIESRIDRVVDYILQHPEDDLSLATLSRLANFSKFHFLRVFQAHKGMSAGKMVQLTRLKRASLQLVFNRTCRITDIALDAGFENPESFSRAFRRVYMQSPSQFRRSPKWELWQQLHNELALKQEETIDMQVEIIEFPETMIAAIEHHGPESQTYNTAMKFVEWRKENGVMFDQGETYGIHYTDPKNTFPEDYRQDICVSVNKPIKGNPQGVITKIIPGGRCAVIRHMGSRDWMVAEVEYLIHEWLPQSGEQLRDFPIYFHYVNVGPHVREPDMITDIYLPIR